MIANFFTIVHADQNATGAMIASLSAPPNGSRLSCEPADRQRDRPERRGHKVPSTYTACRGSAASSALLGSALRVTLASGGFDT